jgi:CheY-like chemotaxis protein
MNSFAPLHTSEPTGVSDTPVTRSHHLPRPHTILLCEDNPEDVDIFRRALGVAKIANTVHYAEDGAIAVDYLSGVGKFSDCEQFPIPSLLFLDLKMPCVNGFEVLDWMRAHREFDQTCVVVLSSEAEPETIAKVYAAGANGYFVKPPRPLDLHAVLSLVAHNKESWIGVRLGSFGVGL